MLLEGFVQLQESC